MESLKRILVAFDFSPESEAALSQSVRLGRGEATEIQLVHALRPEVYEALQAQAERSDYGILAAIRTRLEDAARRHRAGDVRIETTLAVQHPIELLQSQIAKTRPDLAILGCRGAGQTDDIWGSVATAAVRELEVDVLLVRGNHEEAFDTITACLDLRFHDLDRHLLHRAYQLCRREHAQMEVLHVFYPPWERETASEVEKRQSFAEEFTAMRAGEVNLFVDGALGREAGVGSIPIRVEPCRGHALGIVGALLAKGSELAVIAAPVDGAAAGYVLGGMADQIGRGSGCSVLAVREQGFHSTPATTI